MDLLDVRPVAIVATGAIVVALLAAFALVGAAALLDWLELNADRNRKMIRTLNFPMVKTIGSWAATLGKRRSGILRLAKEKKSSKN